MHRITTLIIIGVMGLWIVQALAGSTVTSRMIQKHGTQAQVSSAKLVYEIGIATDTKRAYFGYSTGKKKLVNDDDPRLSDQRTPTAHAAGHAAAGSDPVTPAAIGADPVGTAATVQGNLTSHTNATTDAHGGIVASSDSRLSNDRTPTSHGNDKHSATYITAADAVSPTLFFSYTGAYLRKNGATASDQVYVSDGVGSWIARAWSWIVSKLGLGTAAYTAATDYALEANFRNTSSASAVHRAQTTDAHGGIIGPVTFANYTGRVKRSGDTITGSLLVRKPDLATLLTIDASAGKVGIGGAVSASYPIRLAGDTFVSGWVITGSTLSGGNLQVSNAGDSAAYFTGNLGVGLTTLGTSAAKALGIGNGTAPAASVTGAQIWSEAATGLNIVPSGSYTAKTQISATNLTIPGKITMPQTQTISGSKTLTDNTATGIFEIALPTNSTGIGGYMSYSVTATDGSAIQAHSGYANIACIRDSAAAVTSDIKAAAAGSEAAVSSTPSLTENGWTITNGTGKCTINANFDSSLTSPTITLKYQLTIHGSNAVTQL